MISKKELLREIEELENKQPTYQTCEKLSTLYIIYDHLYGEKSNSRDFEVMKYSYSSSPEPKTANENKKTLLPSYYSYVEAKEQYQYGDASKEKIIRSFDVLARELKTFFKTLYSNTDTPEEREILNRLIDSLKFG